MDDVRIDRWLWAARFYKTRGLATRAVDGGKVHVNGQRTKAAKRIRPGDRLAIRKGPYRFELLVRQLSDRRRPAPEAAMLYEESPASLASRQALAAQRRAPVPTFAEKGRPTKKDRRALDRLRRGRDGR
jgi:ribosome-associated heat shock protein Hsp15